MAEQNKDQGYQDRILELQKQNMELLSEKRVRDEVNNAFEEKTGDIRQYIEQIVSGEIEKMRDPNNEIYESITEKQVKNTIQKYLKDWKAIATYIILGTGLIGFPIWQKNQLQELTKLNENAQDLSKKMSTQAENINRTLDQAKSIFKNAKDENDRVIKNLNENDNRINQTMTHQQYAMENLINSQLGVAKLNDNLSSTEKNAQAARDAHNFAIDAQAKIEDQLKVISELENKVQRSASDVLTLQTNYKSLQEINDKLLRISSSRQIWLFQDDETEEIQLIDVEGDPNDSYFMKFKLGNIQGHGAKMSYKLKDIDLPWSEWKTLGHVYHTKKKTELQVHTIDNTPYELVVDFVYRPGGGPDFVAFHIQPRE